MRALAAVTSGLIGQPMFQLMEVAQELERCGEDVLHFEIGDLDFASPAAAITAVKGALDAGETGYADSRGLYELRETIADRTERALGFRPSLAQILVCPANAVVDFAVRCVADPGEEVVIPDPCFPTYRAVLSYNGVVGRAVRLDDSAGFRVSSDRLRAALSPLTRLIIINSPSNPTGGCLDARTVREIAQIANEHDCFLLSDEVYASLIYNGEHHSPTVYDQCEERTILLGSLSKSHAMAGWRLGYAIGPEVLIEKMGLLQQTILSCLPPFTQRGGIVALEQSEAVTERIAPVLRDRRDALVSGLRTLPGLDCSMPKGGFYAFARLTHPEMSDVEYAEKLLAEEAVCLVPGSHFGPGGTGFVRLSFSATSLSKIDEALGRMQQFHGRHFAATEMVA